MLAHGLRQMKSSGSPRDFQESKSSIWWTTSRRYRETRATIPTRWDCRYAADVVKQYPDKFQGVCRVNPESTSAADDLSKWVEEYGFRGVRLSPSVRDVGDWIHNEELMDPIWKRTDELKVPMLILTGTSRLPAVSKWIERYPDIKISIDHMASCPIDQPEELQKLLDLAKFPHVYVKISHTWSLSKEPYPHRDTWDQVKKLYDVYGPQRLMWGTDWPGVEEHCGYAKALQLVRDEMDFLNEDDKRWMLGKRPLRGVLVRGRQRSGDAPPGRDLHARDAHGERHPQ